LKSILTFFASTLAVFTCCGQCHDIATESFASLANDKSFVIIHDEPLANSLKESAGKSIEFETADGQNSIGYFFKGKSNKYVCYSRMVGVKSIR
jgi:hypothetical protein